MKPPTESEVTSPVVPSVSATESPVSDPSLSGLTRRELLIGGGKVAVVAAVSSLFSPFNINVKAATPKSLSFWQFYSPGGGVATKKLAVKPMAMSSSSPVITRSKSSWPR